MATEQVQGDTPSGFIRICGLYERTTPSGATVLFGKWGRVRVYAFDGPGDRAPSSTQPRYWLCVRTEDYDPKRDGPGGT